MAPLPALHTLTMLQLLAFAVTTAVGAFVGAVLGNWIAHKIWSTK